MNRRLKKMGKDINALTYLVEVQHCVGLVARSACLFRRRLCSVLTPLRMSECSKALVFFLSRASSESPVPFAAVYVQHLNVLQYSPDKVGAVAAEGRLLEEASDELVVLHFMHVLLPQRALPGEASRGPLALALNSRWVGHDGDGMDVVGRNLLDL